MPSAWLLVAGDIAPLDPSLPIRTTILRNDISQTQKETHADKEFFLLIRGVTRSLHKQPAFECDFRKGNPLYCLPFYAGCK
ncbi:hypothetical protein TNCV_497671 [Trichonephila clavipes]|nr:hypothetical protein TNCV_497671 [Trichonephila clavipes]